MRRCILCGVLLPAKAATGCRACTNSKKRKLSEDREDLKAQLNFLVKVGYGNQFEVEDFDSEFVTVRNAEMFPMGDFGKKSLPHEAGDYARYMGRWAADEDGEIFLVGGLFPTARHGDLEVPDIDQDAVPSNPESYFVRVNEINPVGWRVGRADAKDKVLAVYGWTEEGKSVLQAVVFSSDSAAYADKEKWLRERLFSTSRLTEWTALEQVPPEIRKAFDYRLDLIKEWAGYIKEAVDRGVPSPSSSAWMRFRENWVRTGTKKRWAPR